MNNHPRPFLISSGILVLFHISGFLGMQTEAKAWFIDATPLNLLVCLAVVIWNHSYRDSTYWKAVIMTGLAGLMVEMIGVQTGAIFGTYRYGETLGPKLFGAPILIAVNWILVMEMGIAIGSRRPGVPAFLQILIAGTIPVLLDVLIEPAAIRMGWWTWADGEPPLQNYLGWWFTGLLFATVRYWMGAWSPNLMALILLGIQAAFFSLLLFFPVFD